MERPPFESDPVIEFHKKDLDLAVLRRNLALTPEERLLQLMERLRLAEASRVSEPTTSR